MFDHIAISVTRLDRARAFYLSALRALSIELVIELTAEQTGTSRYAGFGRAGRAAFWIGVGAQPSGPAHVALTAASRAEVDAFYRAALDAGGRDNGAPGVRPHYHVDYYAAFVLDPDGNNIEAVCRAPA